ncbi:triple tyrosine motif-containing protein [Sphingomonas sp. KR3-1]|uniref:sensor histidine kinase n=1 Tax=Sphingomonas sp. KR3-1 TaxID=3156611 RepID=UPI0032B4A398
MIRAALSLFIGLAGMLAAGPGIAQLSPPGFEAFKHVRWGADEGAPDGIDQIVQTADGYLWLAGEYLYRFDGTNFERIDWPAGSGKRRASPTGLMVSRSGELWVGMRGSGGVAVYRRGELRDMRMPDPPRTIFQLSQAPDGTIWAASGIFDGQLWRFRGGHWESVGDALKRPEGAIMAMAFAPGGTMWIALTHRGGDSGALAYLAPGASRFQLVPDKVSGRPDIAIDRNGALWLADTTGTRMIVDARGRAPARPIRFAAPPNIRSATLSFDRSGGLWGTTASVGVVHIPPATIAAGGAVNPPPVFGAVNGLTSDFAYGSFVDREGSVWVATEGGIDQFRRTSAVQETAIPADPIHGLAITAANDGSVYIESGQALFRAEPNRVPRQIRVLGAGDLAMCAARDGGIWIVQPKGMLRVRGDRAEPVPGYPGGEIPTNCAEDRLGRLWVALFDRDLVWRDARGWHPAGGALAHRPAWDMILTGSGDLAFTSPPNLVTLRGDRLTVTKDIGTPMIAAGARDIFLSDGRGLVRIRDGQVRRISDSRFPWVALQRSLVQTPRGETWMIGRNAISRVATADLDRAFDDPRAPLERTLFNGQDGLASATQHGGFTGTQSVVGGDGRVWFLNRQGAAYFDPATLQRNTQAPPVSIRSLASGGKVWRDPGSLVLPVGTRALDIAYAGLSLAVPQRVRFRYRLEGVDDGWVEAGSRRMASYANLGPGQYRFQVIAANNDGVWNKAGATLAFEIRPTFLQSWPFKLLCAAALLGLLWLAYSMRMRVVAGRIRLRMAERIEERERIARELHDTLLQSVQSLTLRFQLAVDDLPAKQPGRPALIQAIDTADRVIAEGRDRVHDLRARQGGDIEQIVRDLVARQGFAPHVAIAITATGTPRSMDPLTLDEVTRIAGEALFNIWRHACANRVTVEICHGASFILRIADDGIGIDPELATRGKAGHFGLSGMRERARKLHASLVIAPLRDHGTELVLTVPGTLAYKAERRGLLARLRSS